jgi:hypothetical protein
MTTPAAKHLQTLKNIALRRIVLDEKMWPAFCESAWAWEDMFNTARAIQLPDMTPAVRSMETGVKLEAGAFGCYTGYTRHIEIAAVLLTERAFATCLHEMAHAILHHDVKRREWEEQNSYLECEADLTADIALMLLGYGPRQYTQNTLRNHGNYGDISAVFYHSGDVCIAAAQQIYEAACTTQRKIKVA